MTIRETKEAILLGTDIVDFIGDYVKLRRESQEWVGLCPFHAERSPSFSVNKRKGIFKCFGCGEHGDVISFVEKMERLEFVDALKFIANRRGFQVSFNEQSDRPSEGKKHVLKEREIRAVSGAIMLQSMQLYRHNGLARFLGTRGGETTVLRSLFKYNVGTAKDGAAIFWQIDQFQRVRTAQKIEYGDDGHRVKWKDGRKMFPIRLFKQSDGYTPCLFGEHLLMEAKSDSIIFIVESEKTAVVCDMYLPVVDGREVIWMAACGANGLTDEKIFALKGLNVCLCPDFSFMSRAVWGLLPMRKKQVDGKVAIAEDGEIDAEYVSAAQRLQKLGCTVSFYDPFPDARDGSDIADRLLLNVLPKSFELIQSKEEIMEREGFF